MSEHPRLLHTVLDATDVRGLAEFYRLLLGLRYREGDEPPSRGAPDDADWLVLLDAHGERRLAFQQVEELVPSTWPSPEVPQQLHLDLTVEDVDALHRQRARAEELGAGVVLDRTADPDEPLYVFTDPAGHPFCIFVACGTGHPGRKRSIRTPGGRAVATVTRTCSPSQVAPPAGQGVRGGREPSDLGRLDEPTTPRGEPMGLNPVSDVLKRTDKVLKSAESALASVDTKLSSVDGTLGAVDARMETVDVTLAETRTVLGEVQSLLLSLDEKLALLDEVPALKAGLEELLEAARAPR